jgi:hypothetical protein
MQFPLASERAAVGGIPRRSTAGLPGGELTQLQSEDALDFFRGQGIRGSRAEIEIACEPYGNTLSSALSLIFTATSTG